MSDGEEATQEQEQGQAPEPAYHLFLVADELPALEHALRLLISDEAHEPAIRAIARAVIDGLHRPADAAGRLTLTLQPREMKIAYSAVRLLLNDSRRGQSAEREILYALLAKLPDEHTMRAIQID